MKQHITRAYNSFAIDKIYATLTKTSKESRLKDEINYYKEISNISKECAVYFPRLLDSYENEKGYEMKLEYYAYSNLGDYMVYEDFDKDFWEDITQCIQWTRQEFSQIKKTAPSKIENSVVLRSMYVDKTQRYYKDLIDNFEKFASLSKKDSISINGKKYLNYEKIWSDVNDLIEKKLLNINDTSLIHGDFCFSNILCGRNNKTNTTILKFVDPRGSFGNKGVFGDPLYDAAKLIHSYEGGYEYIIYDQFSIQEDPLGKKYEMRFSNENKNEITRIFGDLTDIRTLSSKLIEGLIFIGMCSRHYDSTSRQTAMYLTGVKILNEVLEGDI